MSKTPKVAYFPVLKDEQTILERLRHADLAGRLGHVLEILDLVADAKVEPADVEQAFQLLDEARQSEGMDARFDNLEARLTARIEKGLTEIEGRLSKRTAGAGPAPVEGPVATLEAEPETPPPKDTTNGSEVPRDASLAFRIGSDVVAAPSAAQFYAAVWRWLFDHGHVKRADLPIQSGKKRYQVAAEPVHPTGKAFYRAEEVHGAFVEVNQSRNGILRNAKKYLDQYGVAYEVLVGSD